MYICTECEHVFDEPKTYSEDRTPGNTCEPGFTETHKGCPYCGGNYDEAIECQRCSKYISIDGEPFCQDCINDILSEFALLVMDNFRQDEWSTILDHLDDVELYKKEDV